MQRTILSTAFLILFAVSAVFAQRINGRSVTSVYTWQRNDTVGTQRTRALGYQSFQLDIYQRGVSLHTYLQGFNDFGFNTVGGPQVSSGAQVRLYNFYVKASNVGNILDLSLGRQPVYVGVGSGTIDGLFTRVRIAEEKLVLVGYAGAVPPSSQKIAIIENVDENYMFGAQFITTPSAQTRFSISYMNRRIERPSYIGLRRDLLNNTFATLISPEPYADEFIGVDASYRGSFPMSVYGRYEYDLNYDRISRGQVFSRVSVTDRLALTGEYIYRSPRLPLHSYFSIFPRNSVEELEGGIEYSVNRMWRVFGRVGVVSYVDEDNRRYTTGVTGEYGTLSYSGSVGYAGKLNSVSAQLYYPLLNRAFVPTLGLSYAEYRLSWDAEIENAFAGILGSTVRPWSTFSIDFQLQWLSNRIVKRDLRFFVRVTSWFSERLNLFK